MGGVFTSFEALEAAVQRDLKAVVNEAESKTYLDAARNTSEYRQNMPQVYEVTYQLENSARTTGVYGGGNYYEAKIYLDMGFNYDTGTWSTPKIFNVAEAGGLINPGHFWQKTEEQAEKNLNVAASKYFG